MTWFRIDDGFDSHPKVLSIPRGAPRLKAIGLWTSIGTWCARNLTDGSFAPHMVAEYGGTKGDLGQLLRVGLWHALGEGCGTDECPAGVPGEYRFHDYLDKNPSRSEIEAQREAKQAAGRAGGKASGRSRREARTKQVLPGRSGLVEPPSRPVPFPMAAAAEDLQEVDGAAPSPPPLPPSIEILRNTLDARKLTVRWDRLDRDQLAEIEALIETHGDGPLVASAMRDYQPDRPVAFAQAWLPSWRQIRRPGHLAVVTNPCTEPGHTGSTSHCKECASERKAAQ